MKRYLCMSAIILIFVSCKKDISSSFIRDTVSSNSVVEQDDFNSNYHLEYTVYMPCTGEMVHAQGDVYLSYHRVERDGGIHLNTSIQSKDFRGIGLTSGKTYRLIANFRQTANSSFDTDGSSTWHVTERFVWITAGGKNNATSTHHITVIRNANGQWVVNREKDIVFSCQ